MTVFSIFNMSGGVGKTTLTMNLSHELNTRGVKTLAVDMDPQASLTTFFGLDAYELPETIHNSLMDSEPLPIESSEWCDLAPANLTLAQAELSLTAELRREYRLADALSKVSDQYDAIIVDGPPSLGLLSVNCLVAADYLIVPLATNYKAVEATMGLLRVSIEIASKVNPGLKVLGLVPTMFDRRTSGARRAKEAIDDIAAQLQLPMFEGMQVFDPVPLRTAISDAQEAHQPLSVYDARNDGLKAIRKIADVMASRIEVTV
ncbi:MAG: ParA family protein [Cyanobacteria bacterium J06650_10]